jgi:hypothetical protein
MDAAGLGITLFVEVYHIAVIIKEVEQTRRRHSKDVEDFQKRLDRETVFLEVFNDFYFKDEDTFRSFQSLPDRMKDDIKKAYEDISKQQVEYRIELLRQGINISASSSLSLEKLSLVTKDSPTKDGKRHRLKEWCKEVVGRADLQWALFDKEKIEELVEVYRAQTQHLKEVLILNLLLERPRPELVQEDDLKKLRMKEVMARQKRAAQAAPSGYRKLEATLEGGEVPKQDNAIVVRTLKQTAPLDDCEVVVEVRSYDEKQRQDSDTGNKDYLKPIEQVVWLLHSDRESSWEEEEDLFTLRCIGFIDQPSLGRSLLCYELPTIATKSPVTLHDLISSHGKVENGRTSRTRPALGMRFRLAHRLCSTLLQVHLSKWVHKSIWSRGVVVFEEDTDLIPYLEGWGLARRAEDESQMSMKSQVEANFYHHSQRWGQPSVKHAPVHDIYSLGVVLLEIGTWRTVSAEFKKIIAQFEECKDLNSTGLFEKKHSALLTLANSKELKSQIGVRYAKAAIWCLEGAVATAETDDEHSTCIISAFKTKVVAELARYIDM